MGNVVKALSTNKIESDEGTDVDNVYNYNIRSRDGKKKTVDGTRPRSFTAASMVTIEADNNDGQHKSLTINQNNCTIFVGNISYKITQRVLWDFFTSFGNVTKACIVMDHIKYHRRSKGFGFVTFSTQSEARKVLKASEEELTLDDRVMRVFPAERKQRELKNIHADQHQQDDVVNKDDEFELSDIESLQEQEITDGINLLPNDVLLYIFSFLGVKDKVQLERVCKRWQSLVLQSWQSLEKLKTNGVFGGFTDKMLTDEILRILLKKGCWNLKEIDLSSSPYLLTDWSVELIGQRCKKLVKLDLSLVKVTKSSLKFLASSCNQLKWIRLKNCNGFGEKGLWWLFHYCRFLEYVDVSANYRISGQCFYMLTDRLTDLLLDDCRSITDEGLGHLVKKCPKLEYLDLSGCVSITSNSVEHLSKELHHLKHLILKGSYHKISQGNLSFLGLTNLEVFVITHNSLLIDPAVKNICKSNTRLRCLNFEGSLEGVTDEGLKAISRYCRNLEELNINYVNKVSADGLQSLSLLINLKELKMKGCHQLNDKVLMTIGLSCLELELIDVTGCINVTEVSIKLLIDIYSTENALNTCRCLTLNVGGTGIHKDYIKSLNLLNSNIHISTTSTILEQYNRQDDDSIILGGMYTDDDDEDDITDYEELKPSNYGDMEWHNDYHDEPYQYHEFLDADDPFLEYEEWDIS